MACIFAGVDPGALGAIALLSSDGRLISVADMPHDVIEKQVVRAGVTKKVERKRVSEAGIADILRVKDTEIHVIVERVGSMPGQGVSSMFAFGEAYGLVRGVAAGLGHSVTLVLPQVWKKAVGCPPGKDGARQRASQLFPSWSHSFRRVRDDGRAEAALIAYWGWTAFPR